MSAFENPRIGCVPCGGNWQVRFAASRPAHKNLVERMSLPLRRLLFMACLVFAHGVSAQTPILPLQINQPATLWNYQSQRGVPISINTNTPGSDGRLPTTVEGDPLNPPATINQFKGFLAFSGVPGLLSNDWSALKGFPDLVAGTNPFSSLVASEMKLPLGHAKAGDNSSPVVIIMRRAQLGATYLSRQISFPFGSEITPPLTDERGLLLTNTLSTDYWLPKPFFTSSLTDTAQGYYWSPNALKAFAIQAGPISVTWIKSAGASAATPPAYTNINGTLNFLTNGGTVYNLYTVHYVVSGSAVKTPQQMYWTEASFGNSGQLVNVPQGSVAAVNVVYNNSFPEKVATSYVDPFTTPPVDYTNSFQELRTLWYANNTIHAYNQEGRAFVEMLGESNPDGSHRFLGFEIVDVFKQPFPLDLTVSLGERLPAYADGRDETGLVPSPLLNTPAKFYYRQTQPNNAKVTLFATYATVNLNDFQSYWLITGVAGIQWPYLFNRYHEVWPDDASKYSHYLRPLVGTEAQAADTAVQLPGTEAPQIPYQDPLPSPLGAKLAPNGQFYSFLSLQYPAQRALLQYSSGANVAFERVFSWLDQGLKTNNLLVGSPATNLSAWDPTNLVLNFSNLTTAPYVITMPANVGARISAPPGELGNSGAYLAGYLLQTNGNHFNPQAYVDPFANGFTQANQGAIIPVNAIPGRNSLEVWWFRQNGADSTLGFKTVYWPSVIAHYNLQWPATADEIILAGNQGSGPLDSLQAKGTIYRQNDPSQPGYNPNEEHALLLAGQIYALSDHLNLTNAGPNYSSAPYVLLTYPGADGRPSMRVWHVRREKPEAGILFDYVVSAGTVLQPPMPLPLLAPPVDGNSQYSINYNREPALNSNDLPVGWTPSLTNSQFGGYARFTYEDRKHEFWVYRGAHRGLPALQVGAYNATNGSFGPLPAATAIRNQTFTYTLHASRNLDSLSLSVANLPPGLAKAGTNSLAITGVPVTTGSNWVTVVVTDLGDNTTVTNNFALVVLTNGTVSTLAPLAITSTNQYSGTLVTYVDRAPFLAQPPTPTNSFTMQFYYQTGENFDWPGVANPPAVGSIVPYLLPRNSSGQFVGDATSRNSTSLDIVYRPVWPSLVNGQPLPTLLSGQTLTDPVNGLAAVRGQSSVKVLYQQSIGLNVTQAPPSVILHDPTVKKTSSLANQNLNSLPGSVIAKPYLGKYFFPNLPPNLVNRVFFDPNTTNLVLQGQFINDIVGDKYLFLNVLRDADLAAVKNLCSTNDPQSVQWNSLVDNLSTPVYTFHEDPQIPGSYVLNPDSTATRGVGELVAITNSDSQVDSYALGATGPGIGYVSYVVGDGRNPIHAGEPVSVCLLRVSPSLYQGEVKVVLDPNPLSETVSYQHTADLAGRAGDYQYDWRMLPPVDGLVSTTDPTNWPTFINGTSLDHYTYSSGSSLQSLEDNYVTLRYRSLNPLARPESTNWSAWTTPQLTEGWIKRVLAGINPFNQRTSDLFNNPVNTTGTIISQAGHRWTGDVALNLEALGNYGLIEIYETVLNRGKAISINSGYNYGPANDALLLAAGYLNDLYMFLGNDAWADAANPTIGIGTADKTYGSIATALYAFKGQVASLREEEQALLRGRDDSLSPGVALNPVYNRLYWNYTRGIDAGEVIYALNYNILDQNHDGIVNAADAASLYPQGHGDAYGHYLTALGGYYGLLMNPNFDWVPRIEAVSVLGADISVDYQDERKFAAAAAALARTGRQVFDLEWRQDYQSGTGAGWDYFDATRTNPLHSYQDGGINQTVTRYWGMDHWATRTKQGAYLNWVVGNALLPVVDPDPTHQGIQKVDRTTVPELRELPTVAAQVQNDLDNAEAGLTPLGLSQNSVPFDLNPLLVTGPNPQTHFEQVYQRAVSTLNNAVVAFDDAQNVTQLMRSEEDSLANLQAANTNQELAYINRLIELFGTPYPDDLGPGKSYPQDYTGPDLLHFAYVENPDTNNFNGLLPDVTTNQILNVDIQALPGSWAKEMLTDLGIVPSTDPRWTTNSSLSFPYNVGPNGFFNKPGNWTGQRESPGSIQQAISQVIAAQNKLRKAIASEVSDKQSLDKAFVAFQDQLQFEAKTTDIGDRDAGLQAAINDLNEAYAVESKTVDDVVIGLDDLRELVLGGIPTTFIFGLADGGDIGKVALVPILAGIEGSKAALIGTDLATFIATSAAANTLQNQILADGASVAKMQLAQDYKNGLLALGRQELSLQGDLFAINEALRALDDAQRAYRALVAKGNRILQERLTFRQHAAALVQGFRTRDAAFRIFQNEKLERYKTLFDLAATYSFLAAQAYDYETGLLNTDQGKSFLNQIIGARALGVMKDGQPQYAGSSTGDPGLSSALAEMKADWDVLKGRLGFNNPDGYGTIVSLRTENYRILTNSLGDDNWRDVLQSGRVSDLRADSDVMRNCLQIDDGSGQAVPGIIITFSTTISSGLNLFGQPLSAGDHNFSPSSFATKIFATGVDFDGYIGMSNPTVSGGTSPPDPTLDPNGLAATPYVYLIPVGVDSLRSPPLGDTSTVRNWNVADLTIPLPFNIGGSGYSTSPFYTSADSLSEPLFGVRKHQAFRPVSSTDAFNTSIYGANGSLAPSQYTNKRLIGRSIWNSQWKLVIPGNTLLANPNQGLDRFIRSVRDIKLYFVTYSYSGN